ncbi:MAG: MucB/RseB C-terminal domain-containing protein [Cellvibrionaceae bacterium]|nr:MucB/RseB C-terminal domain-containing protein [Cellvibrionaceae bacterium]
MQASYLAVALSLFSAMAIAQTEPNPEQSPNNSAAARVSDMPPSAAPAESSSEAPIVQDQSTQGSRARPLTEQERQVIIHKEVQLILNKMSRAVRELDYQGLVTFEFDNHVDSMRISHKVIDGVEHESLVQLNGARREVRSVGRGANCTAIGEHLLRGASMRLGERILRLWDLYQYSILGRQRIADRDALLLGVKPRDEHRYGYVIAVDRETALPLMLELVGGANKVRERFQFVDLKLGADVEFAPEQAADKLVEQVDRSHLCSDREQLPEVHKTRQTWEAAWLPEGFVFSGQQASKAGGDQIMYTDGLNALSIFVQPASEEQVIIGTTHRGATSVVMSKMSLGQQLYTVTAVGEIPGGSLRQIAESVRSKTR